MIASNWPAVVFLLHGRPRTVPELVELTGNSRGAVIRTLNLLAEEGLIDKARGRRIEGTAGGIASVWTWVRP